MSARNGVVVRSAVPDDAAALARLWTTAEDSTPSALEAATALEYNASVNGHRVSVALIDGEIVGALVHQLATVTPVSSTKTLGVLDLRVADSRRKRAVEVALLAQMADLAHELGCEFVVASAPVADREVHRLLTRMGFTQTSVVRSVAVSRLMARVASSQPASRETSRLVAVRRTMRRRQEARTTPRH